MVSHFRVLTFLCVMFPLCLTGGGKAVASPPRALDLTMNIAELLRLDQPAATIIVGNPEIADVSIVDELTVLLTGRAAGVTNLITMDADGGQTANVELRVSDIGARHVLVRHGLQTATFVCTPACRPVQALRPPPSLTSPPVQTRNETELPENGLPEDDAVQDEQESSDMPQVESVPD